MSDLLGVFGSYDFLMRDAMLTVVLGYSVYLLLNAGIFAVPQMGFMAFGGYTSAILDTKLHWPVPVTVLCGVVMGALVGALLGALLARLNGIYLAIGTIAFSEIVRVAAQNLKITGGLQGLVGINTDVSVLYIVGALAICICGIVVVGRSRHGIAITAMRSDPLMTSHQGVSTTRYRLTLFAASGAVAALSGSLGVHLTGFVESGSYTFAVLTTVLAAVVVGGMKSVAGPILGACVILGSPQILSWLATYRDLVNGMVIVLVVAVAPGGLAALGKRWLRWFRQLRRAAPTPSASTADHIHLTDGEAAAVVTSPASELTLAIDGVERNFGGVRALQGVSTDVRAGEVFGLMGPNGSGKSTLLNVLSGVYKPSSGHVRLAGRELDAHFGVPSWLSRAGVARTFQNIRLVDDLSVADNIRLGGYYRLGRRHMRGDGAVAQERPLSRRERHAEVDLDQATLVADFGLGEILDQEPNSLPYGLQRRVEICRALLSRPDVLLLDEPTAGMTPSERADVFAAIRAVASRGILVVVVEHDVESMLAYCDRVAILHFGQLIAIGDPKEVIESEAVIEAYVGGSARG